MAASDPQSKQYAAELRKMFEARSETMSDRQMLALLLSYTKCKCALEVTVDNIINYFGSCRACFFATHEELMSVEGITYEAAMLIHMVSSIYSMRDKMPKKGKRVDDIEELFLSAIGSRRDEAVYAAALDADNKLLGFEQIAVGKHDCVQFNVSDIVDYMAYHKASRIAVGHNHPGADVPEESEQDEQTAMLIGEVCSEFGVDFIGQVIVVNKSAKLFAYKRGAER